MATSTQARARKLPPITVGKFEAISELIENLVNEHTDVFLAAQQRYRDRHRETTSRPLSPTEAAQVAAAMAGAFENGTQPGDAAANIQTSALRAYDEPDPREVLLAAGVATAPAFLRAAQKVVALIELPTDAFQEASEEDRLDDAIDEAIRPLRDLPLIEARARASRALKHFADASGAGEGKAWELLIATVITPLQQTIKTTAGASSSLTGSAPSTEDSPDRTSSTGSGTGTPSS